MWSPHCGGTNLTKSPNIWRHRLSSLQFQIFWALTTYTCPDDHQVKVWELQLKLICGAFGDKSPQFGRGRLLGNNLDLPPPPHKHDVFHHMKLASGWVWSVQRDRQVVSFLAALAPSSPVSSSGALCRPPASKRLNQETQFSWYFLSLLAIYDMSEETSLPIILVIVLPILGLFAYFSWSIS